jgi:adenylate cyclase
VLQIVRIIGGRTLINFVLGKYYRPIREEKIFMFLDLVGSTALAERLGDIGVQTMITRFFFDISEPIIENGGEVHRYVGDQVVVTWPLKAGEDNCYRHIKTADICRRINWA